MIILIHWSNPQLSLEGGIPATAERKKDPTEGSRESFRHGPEEDDGHHRTVREHRLPKPAKSPTKTLLYNINSKAFLWNLYWCFCFHNIRTRRDRIALLCAELPRDTFQYRSLNLKSPSQDRSSSLSPARRRDSTDSGRALGIIRHLDGESAIKKKSILGFTYMYVQCTGTAE